MFLLWNSQESAKMKGMKSKRWIGVLANILGSIWIPFAVYTFTSILLNRGTVLLLSFNYGQIILINFERKNITFKMYLEGYMAVRGGNFLSGPSPRPIKIALIQFPITCFLWIKQEFLALKHKNGLSWLILKFCFQRNMHWWWSKSSYSREGSD